MHKLLTVCQSSIWTTLKEPLFHVSSPERHAACFCLLSQEESLVAEMNWCRNREPNYIKCEILISWIMNRLICKGSLQEGNTICILQEMGRKNQPWPPLTPLWFEQSRFYRHQKKKVVTDRGFSSPLSPMAFWKYVETIAWKLILNKSSNWITLSVPAMHWPYIVIDKMS